MKSTIKVIISALLMMAMTFTTHVANAEPTSQQKTSFRHSTPAKLAQAYNLNLSLDKNWHSGSTIPVPNVYLTNLGPDTFAFSLDSNPGDGLTVEYQVEYKNDAITRARWENLKSNVPPPTNRLPGQRPRVSTFSVLTTLHPGEQYHDLYNINIVGYPMLDKGLYRITAYATIPKAMEVAGSDNAPTFVKKLDLKIHSNPIVLRRTASEFVAVDAATGKQVTSP